MFVGRGVCEDGAGWWERLGGGGGVKAAESIVS